MLFISYRSSAFSFCSQKHRWKAENGKMNKRKQYKRQSLIRLVIVIAIIVVVNILDSSVFKRIDLTNEKIYTLTDSTKSLLRKVNDVVFVKVYLHGDFPAGFKRLEKSTKEMLDEFRVYTGDNLQYEFIDPLAGKSPEEKQQIIKQLENEGLYPTYLQVSGEGLQQSIIFPGAILSYRGRETPIILLENQGANDPQETLNNSVALLEHKFAFGIKQLSDIRKPKIGITYTHGELAGYNLYDLRKSLESLYLVDSLDISKLSFLKKFYDAVIIPRPTEAFSENEKFLLDQYIMNGGKVLWMLGGTNADEDSLHHGAFIAQGRDLNLNDQLFKYGIRINPDLILDLNCNRIPVLGPDGQTQVFPFPYFPLISPDGDNPIVKNLSQVAFQFTSSINPIVIKGVKETILLHSSLFSKLVFTPWRVDFSIFHEQDKNDYTKADIPVAVMLDGIFESLYKYRLAGEIRTVLDTLKFKVRDESKPTKMIVISDGNVAKNGFDSQIYPMGFYRYQAKNDYVVYDNKDFILNCIESLTDNAGLIESRSKEIKLRLLDTARVHDEQLKWQLINILVPIGIIILIGLVFNFVRNRRYAS
jgi:ABC-2 type transport system permease protein